MLSNGDKYNLLQTGGINILFQFLQTYIFVIGISVIFSINLIIFERKG